MDITGRIRALATELALWTGLGIFCLVLLLAGISFLIAAFYLWLLLHESEPAAAAITGGVMVLIAALALPIGGAVVRKRRKPQPSLLAEAIGMAGMGSRLVSFLVRRDPKKAMIVAMMAGALAEIIAVDKKK